VTIPDSVTSIESRAFVGCSSLKSIIFEGNAPDYQSDSFEGVSDIAKIIIRPGATGFGGTLAGIPVVISDTPPEITIQPEDQEVKEGDTVTFKVTAVGDSLTYQWKKNGQSIQNATKPELVITGAKKSDEGEYSVVVKNEYGETTSNTFRLTVPTPPEITIQRGSQGTVVITFNSPDDGYVIIQSTDDFEFWEELGTLLLTDGKATLSLHGGSSRKFYRAVKTQSP
jgi:hypothetical protein